MALVFRGEKVLVRRRPEEGLLAGLYEFPSFAGARSGPEVLEALREIGVTARRLKPAGSAHHMCSPT